MEREMKVLHKEIEVLKQKTSRYVENKHVKAREHGAEEVDRMRWL